MYCELRGKCGNSEVCNGRIGYDMAGEVYFANHDITEKRDTSSEIYCTLTNDLSIKLQLNKIQKRQAEALEKIVKEMQQQL